ncbi:MAG TPA: hypothetical protein VFB38_11455 [Chthonomonadaceae bacterium]|nr:hypothetical protein [Chthonomonadaceae bacterium]
MIPFAFLNAIYARWQIRRAINCLDDADEAVRARAEEQLRAVSPACWSALCRAAFRRRSSTGVTAARLLYDLGDARGLFALLEQFYDRDMYCWYGPHIRRALKQIGNEKVLAALETALTRMETLPLAPRCWSLYVAVYALHALAALHGYIPSGVWRRALTVHVPFYEDVRACRLALTAEWPETPAVATLAAVRRAAVDALLALNKDEAFALLREALAHPAPQVQLTTIYGLRLLKDTRAYVLLQPIAADRRHPLARDARRAIESLGTRQPDALTLVRASQPALSDPGELLRPAASSAETLSETLLRPLGPESKAHE